MDWVPVINNAKFLVQGIIGKDLITGADQSSLLECGLNIGFADLPYASKLKEVVGAFKGLEEGGKAVVDSASAYGDKIEKALSGVRSEETSQIGQAVCGANSFRADTLVETDAQGHEQAISTLKVGDHVLAYDEQSGTTGIFTITAVLIHTDPMLVDVTIDGEQLETTPEHPFYTQEYGWVGAGYLWQGAHIRRADGSFGVMQAGLLQETRFYLDC